MVWRLKGDELVYGIEMNWCMVWRLNGDELVYGMETQLWRLLNGHPTRTTLSSLPHLHRDIAFLHSVYLCATSARWVHLYYPLKWQEK